MPAAQPVPVYLFTGPEEGEKKTAVLSIKSTLKKKSGQIEEYTYYATETEVSDVVLTLRNESLFADARFVLVHNADLIKKKEDIDQLKSWIEESQHQQHGGSVLVLESEERGIDKKLENLVPKENRKIFWEMFENKKEEWLRNFFAQAGYRVTPDTIETILNMVQNNTESLAAECSRFFVCFPKDKVITPDDAESILIHNREESAFTLFETLTELTLQAERRLENALSVLLKIRGTKKGDVRDLVPGLTWCFRRIDAYRALLRESPNPSQIEYTRAGFGIKSAQIQYRNASRIWNEAQVGNCLALLASVETETRVSPDAADALLETLLYQLVIKQGEALEHAVFTLTTRTKTTGRSAAAQA